MLRWLFLTHRWVGIASCLLFAMWFASGLVMLYVPYPRLTPAARLARASPIDWTKVDVLAPLEAGQVRLLLEMRDAEPVWRIERDDGVVDTIPARKGTVLPAVDGVYARHVASRFAGLPAGTAERLLRDQWTVAGGFDRHRPLWRVRLSDADGTDIYVSSSTGLAVQRTTRSERFWNWLGSVPHWLYPTILRQDNAAWRQVVLWVSGPCIAVALTGIWIGILRVRLGQRRYKDGRVSPYRGWMLWHHVSGLVGGLSLLTWIVSGWLSVDPGRLFAGTTTPAPALHRYQSLGLIRNLPPVSQLALVTKGARTVEFTGDAGLPRLTIDRASDHPRYLHATVLRPATEASPIIAGAARTLVADGQPWKIDRLSQPDNYWASGQMLPILRLRFDDPARTWLYIDPVTGELIERQDRARRLYRWVFDFLHAWNWLWLIEHQPLRDVVIWLLSIVGLALSVTGVWVGFRRLVRQATS